MKHPVAFLATSVAANLALCALVLMRGPLVAPSTPEGARSGEDSSSDAILAADAAQGPEGTHAAAGADATLWKQLHDEDPAAFEKRMRAAGLPDHAVSALLAAEARERVRQRQGSGATTGRSLSGDDPRDTASPNSRDSSAVRVVDLPGGIQGPLNRNLDFIDPSRRDQARAIARDYDTMIADIRRGGAILTDAEKQMISTLESERHQDLQSILTPEELADFEMLKSPLYSRLAHETQEFKPTLAEFRAIYALEKQYADRFGTLGTSSSVMPRREDRAAAEQFRAAADDELLLKLGTERFTEYDRSRNFEYRELSKLARRVNLPPTVAAEVFSMRDYVSVESNRIYDDTALTSDQKRTALQTLATGVRDQIRRQLGNEAGTAYLQVADRWLVHVEQGASVTFKTHNSTMFRRIPTPKPPTPGGG